MPFKGLALTLAILFILQGCSQENNDYDNDGIINKFDKWIIVVMIDSDKYEKQLIPHSSNPKT